MSTQRKTAPRKAAKRLQNDEAFVVYKTTTLEVGLLSDGVLRLPLSWMTNSEGNLTRRAVEVVAPEQKTGRRHTDENRVVRVVWGRLSFLVFYVTF